MGGIAGGIAMVIPAEIYGIVRFHSIWYVVNLLGGAGVGDWVNPTVEQMSHFRLSAFITANIIQGATTLLVGLLYGAMLPMWPKHPILLGGIIAPVGWTGLLYSMLGIVNPFLAGAHRLVVVRGFAGDLRTGCWICGDEARDDQASSTGSARGAARCGDAGLASGS